MWDFSEDETVFFGAALLCGGVSAGLWYSTMLRLSALQTDTRSRRLLCWTPVVALAVLLVVLQTLADPVYVAGHLDYTLLFMLGGACWAFVVPRLFTLLGVSATDDAMLRRNPAAAIAVAGGILGVMFAYAGSNVGNGPTIWTTLAPAFVSTAVLLALWLILELIGGAAEAITVERDTAAGIRLAAFLVSAGAILGRAMAGDWSDWNSTFSEFQSLGWPAALLVPAMIVMNRAYRPTPEQALPPVVRCGVQPAVVMLALAAAYLLYLGAPEVAPAPR
jgi:uncharacterized membrane protein YjfL (UPF0719 family)